MKKSLLIFDFDGTIANTWVVATQIINDLRHEFSLPQIQESQLAALKGKRAREVIKMSGLRWYQVPIFIRKARKLFKKYMEHVPPIAGMPEALQSLRQQGYQMGILTSNSEEGVRAFLEKHKLNQFEFVLAPDSLFGKGPVIKKIIKHRKLNKESVIMIGDEVRDIQAANNAGVDSIAVCWGFNSEELLISSSPTHVVKRPQELESFV